MGSSVRALIGILVTGAALLGSGTVQAESAADRATARPLATEGIQLFQQGKVPEALDKLERAQALYDAPIHLVYIARCQIKLNRFVDAAETYRRLVRTELAPNAPQAFKDAVEDARDELAELEPRIPVLRIEVKPTGVEGMEVKIDSQVVSAAVLGVDRPIKPGFHVVEVRAPDYAPYSKTVEVKPGTKDVLPVALVSQPGAKGPLKEGDGEGGKGGKGGDGKDKEGGVSGKTADYEPRLAIVIGLRGNGVILGGNIDQDSRDFDSRAMSDRFGFGGGGEAQLGVSIPISSFLVTPFVGFTLDYYLPGPYYKRSVVNLYGVTQNRDVEYFSQPSGMAFEVGGRFSYIPKGGYGFGLFGDVAVLPMQSLKVSGKLKHPTGECAIDEEYSGVALGLGAGALFALSPSFALNARFGFTPGQFSSGTRTLSGECSEDDLGWVNDGADAREPNGDITARDTHYSLSFGLGAEFGIGL
jgi:hypothetical protein